MENETVKVTVVRSEKLIPLVKLPERINRECEAVNRNARDMLRHILQCGDYLNMAKKQVAYGQFETWLEVNCQLGHAQAHRYMNIAKVFPKLSGKQQRRAAELTSFRQIMAAVTGKQIGGSNGKPEKTAKRPTNFEALHSKNDCAYRGCVRPAVILGFCAGHVVEGVCAELTYADAEIVQQVIDRLQKEVDYVRHD